MKKYIPIVLSVLMFSCSKDNILSSSEEKLSSPSDLNSTVINGCSISSAGRVGIGNGTGELGDQVIVPISLYTNSIVPNMLIDITFPANLLRWDYTSRGELVTDFDFFGGAKHPSLPLVRTVVNEFGQDRIEENTQGNVAYLHFTVIGKGVDRFQIAGLGLGLSQYKACDKIKKEEITLMEDN